MLDVLNLSGAEYSNFLNIFFFAALDFQGGGVLRAVPETGFGSIPVRRVPPLLLDFCWLADIHASTNLVAGLKSLSIAHPIGSEFLDTWPHRGIHF